MILLICYLLLSLNYYNYSLKKKKKWFLYSVTESLHTDSDARFYVQHLIRKLGSEAYIGQRTILSVSQRISVQAESLLFLDPFDDAFPNMHECMFKL